MHGDKSGLKDVDFYRAHRNERQDTGAVMAAGLTGLAHGFKSVEKFMKISRLAGLIGLSALVLAGCNSEPLRLPTPLVKTEESNQFRSVPLNAAWVNLPSAMVVIERGLRDSMEQRISLPNTTTVLGDNSVLLRARRPAGSDVGRFNYSEFMKRVGTVPAPFGAMTAGDLMSDEDEIGPYFWAEDRIGGSTICVLALRRMTSGMRQLPQNYTVLDMMMRNCVDGTLEDALAPILASHVGFSYGVAGATGSGESRMLSPLAGPTPR